MSGAGDRPVFGMLEWLRPGEEERVEQLLADLKTIGADELRTGISWADCGPGDQRYCVSNFSKFQPGTCWTPQVGMREVVERLHAWLREFHWAAAGQEVLATA